MFGRDASRSTKGRSLVISITKSTHGGWMNEVWHASVTRAPGCAKVHERSVEMSQGRCRQCDEFRQIVTLLDSRDRSFSIYPLPGD